MPDRTTSLIASGRPARARAVVQDWNEVLTGSLAAGALTFLSAVVFGLV
jgi:hypothetical protein